MNQFCDNAIVHLYPSSPFVAKCAVHLRKGKKIVLRVVLRDQYAAADYLCRHFPVHMRTIVHWDDLEVKA